MRAQHVRRYDDHLNGSGQVSCSQRVDETALLGVLARPHAALGERLDRVSAQTAAGGDTGAAARDHALETRSAMARTRARNGCMRATTKETMDGDAIAPFLCRTPTSALRRMPD